MKQVQAVLQCVIKKKKNKIMVFVNSYPLSDVPILRWRYSYTTKHITFKQLVSLILSFVRVIIHADIKCDVTYILTTHFTLSNTTNPKTLLIAAAFSSNLKAFWISLTSKRKTQSVIFDAKFNFFLFFKAKFITDFSKSYCTCDIY